MESVAVDGAGANRRHHNHQVQLHPFSRQPAPNQLHGIRKGRERHNSNAEEGVGGPEEREYIRRRQRGRRERRGEASWVWGPLQGTEAAESVEVDVRKEISPGVC